MSKNIEVEIRADLTSKEYERILESFMNPKLYFQTNYYLDDLSLSFSSENNGLRIREKDKKYELTLKIKTGENYIEINQEIPAKAKENIAKPGFFPSGEVKKYLETNELINPNNLYIRCSLKTTRCDYEYKGTVISLDKNEYFDIVDYNIECESINNDNVESVLKDFLSSFNIELKKSQYTKLQKAILQLK